MTDDAEPAADCDVVLATEDGPVFVDADNTLWDTDRVFAMAQLEMLERVETLLDEHAETDDRLGFVRVLDQLIAERHHSGLRYPPRLLAKAVALVLKGVEPKMAARFAWTGAEPQSAIDDQDVLRIERAFLTAIRQTPELREGVTEGLRRLHAAGRIIVVVTEGMRDKVMRTARGHNLYQYIDRIIEAPKHARLYRRVQKLAGASSPGYMVGDQLERDIRPAKEAGLTTVYYPGGFKPRWEIDAASTYADYTVLSFADVPNIVLGAEFHLSGTDINHMESS